MKIAHSAIATPNRCGLYETARELVAAERALGVDARIVDPLPDGPHRVTGEDRGVPITNMDWATKADLIVNHSGFDRTPLQHTTQPVIHVAHGRPMSTFMGERSGKAPGLTWQTQRRKDPRYRAVVTFWPEFVPHMENIWEGVPVHAIPPTCNLDYWTPGETTYDFHGRGGSPNVVMLDPWSREDSSPYHQIHAFRTFQRKYEPRAKLHLFAWDGNKKALTGLTNLLDTGGGIIQAWATDVRSILRAADLLITPHRIYTRSIREAMACGTRVVSGRDVHPEDIDCFARKMSETLADPTSVRPMAEALFSPQASASGFIEILESVLDTAGAI